MPFSALAGWDVDDHAAAFQAFCAGREAMLDAPPKTRGLGVCGSALRRVARLARAERAIKRAEAKQFFERYFSPHRVEADGFVTGYFEPEVEASRVPGGGFTVPLYRRPGDLVEVDDTNRPDPWPIEFRFARRTAAGLEPHFDRAEIERGALAGRGLELAWLRDPIDAFFIHVQGSARLKFADGGAMRIAYGGKSGHPYTSIGRLAVERGILRLEDAHKDSLEAWLRSHPVEGRALMRENRSFIFFRETQLADGEGPMGAAGVPLTPGRSLAVDRTRHTFHTPIWVAVDALADPDRHGTPFRRLMIAQDTGSAIVGPARGDLFFGSGERAGRLAGRVRHAAEMFVLVPNPAVGAE